ncbi:MAG: 16S rRNA (cytosine(1402)-N(4))-methyltransferase RsmH [Pseudomonadota bacterium]
MTGARHKPVLLGEVLAALAPADGETHVDATLGAGGYARAILETAKCRLVAFDRDPTAHADAAAWAPTYADRFLAVDRPFAALAAGLADAGVGPVDGVVFDLGVSSMQLDDGARGFSFLRDGPLSMRMDGKKPDAADVVALAETGDLAAIFRAYGEEKRAASLARAVIAARADAPIETTGRLAAVVEAATPAKLKATTRIHPATRVFQALRIFVNDELGQLARALTAAEAVLRAGGRLVVVTFHSLEDRIVKRFFADRSGRAGAVSRHEPAADGPPPTFLQTVAKAAAPQADEIAANPRARSAKLRAGVRTAAPARSDAAAFAPPPLSLSKSMAAFVETGSFA